LPDDGCFRNHLENILVAAASDLIGERHGQQRNVLPLGNFRDRDGQRRGERAENGNDIVLRDQPLRDGACSRGRRRGICDYQIDLCAAELLNPARRIDLVSDKFDAIARVDPELSVRSR
jgi:hypothetical protein